MGATVTGTLSFLFSIHQISKKVKRFLLIFHTHRIDFQKGSIMKHFTSAALAAAVLTAFTPFIVTAADGTGDVNADGVFNTLDVVCLQRWLLCDGTVLQDSSAADFYADGILDVFDLALMKRALMQKEAPKPNTRRVDVSTVEELFIAVRTAQPGDVIAVEPGTYDYTTYQGAQKIDTSAQGTAEAPITLTAADPTHPPVLTGTSPENGYVLQITGDYWIVDGICLTDSQKGLVLDNSNHTIVRGCEIRNTGSEAVALRDGSSYCLIQGCYIHDSGLVTPGYGEGVYIGSSYTVTGFDYKCDYNTVDSCTFRNIAAEHVDVKEYTTGTEIKNCFFYGDGMSGANFAGSFVDIAGNDCYVHDNTGYRNQNPNIVAAFEIHDQADGWGYHSRFEG
ncbi:MAG: right-handed parallel beta-helix repeat-containing protein, partial [Oscillospiraceae bacterium]|nr:right-handed parallel beta-helix repeat-containing protein [Oscillospiraceae bacterium]